MTLLRQKPELIGTYLSLYPIGAIVYDNVGSHRIPKNVPDGKTSGRANHERYGNHAPKGNLFFPSSTPYMMSDYDYTSHQL